MILLFACAEPVADPVPVVVSDEEVFAADALAPTLAVEELESIVASTMMESFYTPLDVYEWTDELMEGVADDGEGCPTYDVSADTEDAWTSFWAGECDGEHFSVAGDWQYTVQRTEGTDGSVDAFVLELHSVWGETTPGGAPFAAGGALVIVSSTLGGKTSFDMEYSGSYREEGRPGPLGDGVSGALSVLGDLTAEGFVGTIDGSMYGAHASIEFVDLALVSGCGSPSGQILIRDPSSGWWSVVLADDCMGCGPATYRGEEYGTVCIGPVVHDSLDARLAPYVGGVL